MRRTGTTFINSENVNTIFLVIILIAATIYFIQLTQNLNIRSVKSRDVDPSDEFQSVQLKHQLTQEIIRSDIVNNENKNSKDWNSISVGPTGNLTYVKDLNVTEVLIRPKLNDAMNLLVPLHNIKELFREVNETDKAKGNLTIKDTNVKLNEHLIVPNLNQTKPLAMEQERYKDQVENNSVDHIQDLSIKIVRNHSALSRLLSNLTKNEALMLKKHKRPNYCPVWPSKLVGHMDMEAMTNSTDISKATRQLIGGGGIFKPKDCSPRERTAIIIPYRDRDKHLQILLRHLHNVLQRQMIEYGIYVIEMAYPTQFNRGLLANVGFLTASSIYSYTCYIIHDVDLLMMDDRNMYRCGRVPRHLTASNTKYTNRLPYLAYFGGVVAFTPEQFWKVNGFSNLYFGWGGEDDDMVHRIFHTKQHFSRPKSKIGGYTAIEHSSDSANPVNPNRGALVKSAVDRMSVDGVRTIMYQRLALEFKPLYTWVYISVQEAKIMHKYQEYLQEAD